MITDKKELIDNVKNNLNTLFQDVQFTEYNHTYLHKPSEKYLVSVSKKYKEFEIPFDPKIAKFIAPKMGISEEQLLWQWREKGRLSAERGTRIHKFAEEWIKDNTLQPSDEAEQGVIQFFMEHPNYVVVSQELIMFHKLYMYAGTMDLLLYDTVTEEFIVADWKTNEDLHKNFKKQKLLEPFTDMLQCPLSLYKIQLNLYDMCFESIDFPIERRIIIWLQKDSSTNKLYQLFEAEDLKSKIKEYYGKNS